MAVPAKLGNTIRIMDLGKDAFLTVVIPVTLMASRLQNLEKTLVQCRQNRVKVVLVHDVQDAETGPELQNLVRDLSQPDSPFITLIEKFCGSPGQARNLGKKLVFTEWVAFWDSDDIAEVSKFLLMIDEANKSGDQIAVGGYRVIDSNSKSPLSIREFTGKKAKRDAEIFLNPGIWRWGFLNDLIAQVNFQDFKMGEDQIFLLDSSVLDHRIYYSPNVVYDYFVNSNFQSTNNRLSFARLGAATSYIFASFERKSGDMKKFATVVLLRLFFTGIRRCNFIDKVNLIRQFSSQFLVIGFHNPWRISSALWLVAKGNIRKVIK